MQTAGYLATRPRCAQYLRLLLSASSLNQWIFRKNKAETLNVLKQIGSGGGGILPKTFGSKFASVNLRVWIQRFCFVVSLVEDSQCAS
jgi:hypothetical protein